MTHNEYESQSDLTGAARTDLLQAARLVTSGLGILVAVIGLVLALQLFAGILEVLRDPSGITESVTAWSELIGGESLQIRVEDNLVPVDRPLAVLLLGLAAAILVQLAVGLMTGGAKLVSFAAGDREVKRFLQLTLQQLKQARHGS